MFGIGWSELLVILAIALLVIGPKELPRVLYLAGKFIRKIKVFTSDIQRSLDNIMREEELEEIVREANKAGGDNLQFELDRQAAAEARRRALEKEAETRPRAQPETQPLPEGDAGDKADEKKDAGD